MRIARFGQRIPAKSAVCFLLGKQMRGKRIQTTILRNEIRSVIEYHTVDADVARMVVFCEVKRAAIQLAFAEHPQDRFSTDGVGLWYTEVLQFRKCIVRTRPLGLVIMEPPVTVLVLTGEQAGAVTFLRNPSL